MAEIDRFVRRVLLDVGMTDDTPPSLGLLADRLGVRIERMRLRGMHGGIKLDAGEPVIMIDDRLAPTRARFTIAHEIGHWVLAAYRLDAARVWRSHPSLRDPERLCERFAESLLMPDTWVRDRLDGVEHNLHQLVSFAADAEVSLAAASVRTARVAGWRRTLLRFALDTQGWLLQSVTGYLRPGWRETLRPARETNERLLAWQRKGEGSRGYLLLLLHGRPWYAMSESRVHPRAAVVWADLLALRPPTRTARS